MMNDTTKAEGQVEGSKEKETMVDYGVDDEATNKPDVNPTSGSSFLVRRWKIAGIVVGVALLVFVIVFPTVMVHKGSSNEKVSTSLSSNLVTGANKTNTTSDATTTKKKIVLIEGPLNSTLETLSEDIIRGYNTQDELKSDLTQAANFLVSSRIIDNVAILSYNNQGTANDTGANNGEMMPEGSAGTAAAPTASDSASFTASGGAQKVSSNVNDYGTNNQEKGVEEGDLIVSDGVNVYAAFDDHVVVWNVLTGKIVSKTQMPTMEEMQQELIKRRVLQKIAGGDLMYYNPKPYVSQLLIHEGRLLVIVQGYGMLYSNRTSPILYDYMNTHVRVYDTNGGALKLIDWTNLNGSFQAVRAVGGTAHIVCVSGVDTYTYLGTPFDVYYYGGKVGAEQYTANATAIAGDIVKKFVDDLFQELPGGGNMPNMIRMSTWQDQMSNTSQSSLERATYPSGFFTSVAFVHSLVFTGSKLDASAYNTTGAFLPSWGVQVYSSLTHMILATSVYEYNETDQTSTDSTALISLSLDETSATAQAIGKIKGYILNSYSLDVFGSTLRIASTIATAFFLPLQEDVAADVLPVVETEPRTENYVTLLSLPEGNANNTGTMQILGQLKLGKPKEVFTAVRFFDDIAYAGTFERRDPFYVLDLSDASAPKVVSALDISGFSSYLHPINNDNTLILAIGEDFNENGTEQLGLMLTVFDMRGVKDGKNATIAQKYNIETSAYAYSSSDSEWDYKAARYVENRLIIPLDISTYYCNETTGKGGYTGENFRGFKVFVATADIIEEECAIPHGQQTDPYPYYCGTYMPIDVVTMMPENTTETGTMMSGNETNSVSVAVPPDGGGSVGVPNMPPVDCVYCGGYLPRRSFVFNGDLMTTSGSEVILTDLANCTQIWKQEIILNASQTCCDGFIYF